MMCLRPPVTAPIINLEHADMAYEWEFCGVNDFHRANMKMDEAPPGFHTGGRRDDGRADSRIC